MNSTDEQMDKVAVMVEELEADDNSGDAEVGVVAGTSCILPHKNMDRLWENLYYDYDTKTNVLYHAEAALRMAHAGVPPEVVSCNRIALMHGPPGTGKTTFCKALAQKLAIRMSPTYPRSRFLEVNSHSLYSKWFSESGKLVQKLFGSVVEQLEEDPGLLYIVLIDEVESLASSRSSGGHSDPQDAVRAGNAVLTQLDRLKRYPNVFVLTTSNLTHMIDGAFTDRLDIKQFIGPPNEEARYEIVRAQVEALVTSAVLRNDVGTEVPLLSWRQMRRRERRAQEQQTEAVTSTSSLPAVSPATLSVCSQLLSIAQQSVSLGGRALRRAPLHCYTSYLQQQRGRSQGQMSLSLFLQQLPLTLAEERRKHTQLKESARTYLQQERANRVDAAAADDGMHTG